MQGRVLHFIRHGQYKDGSDAAGGKLTALGRRQARHTGRWLSRFPVRAVRCSDLGRAVETATVVADATGVPVRTTSLLREVAPTGIPGKHVPLASRQRGRSNLASIRERFFRRTRGTRHEVLICHGNLIRALLCSVLDVQLTTWRRMRIHHCSFTRFAVESDDSVWFFAFNETGHLPATLITET